MIHGVTEDSSEKLGNYNPKLKCDRNLEESFHSLDYFTSRLGLLFKITLNCPWKLQKLKFRLKYVFVFHGSSKYVFCFFNSI